jgi:conjugative transposon TraM protein
LSYYEQAASDSLKRRELAKNDPYFSDTSSLHKEEGIGKEYLLKSDVKLHNVGSPANNINETADYNETRVYNKLKQLDTELKQPATIQTAKTVRRLNNERVIQPSMNSTEVDRLEELMHTMSQKEGDDPEVQQLNGMLEKILDIQHPERVKEKIRQTSVENKGRLFAVSKVDEHDVVTLLSNQQLTSNDNSTGKLPLNRFYSIDEGELSTEVSNAIDAVIHEKQTLVDGSTVKLRLINDVYIGGVLIPKHHFLFGTASIDGERLMVKINSIRYLNALFPVELSIYDLDGMEGVYIPGAITRDVAKQSADRAVQNIGLSSIEQTIGMQVANTGIEAAKSLVSKKVKLVKVTVKAGYQVLLRDKKQK